MVKSRMLALELLVLSLSQGMIRCFLEQVTVQNALVVMDTLQNIVKENMINIEEYLRC